MKPDKPRKVAPGVAIHRTDEEIDDSDYVERLLQSVSEEAQAEVAGLSPKLDAILKAKDKEQ